SFMNISITCFFYSKHSKKKSDWIFFGVSTLFIVLFIHEMNLYTGTVQGYSIIPIPMIICALTLNLFFRQRVSLAFIERNLYLDLAKRKELLLKQVSKSNEELTYANKSLKEQQEHIQSLQSEIISKDRMCQLGILASGFAHQFNNVLNTIKANTQVLALEGLEHEEKNEHIKVINRATGHGADLVKSISLSAQQNQEIRPITLSQIIQSSVALMRGKLGEQTKVIRDFPPTYQIQGKESNLINIFMVLFGNSADAGATEIRVEAEGNQLVVSDNGHGIPEDIQNKIFELHFTTKDQTQGMGIGLSIAKRDAEAMGATIACDNSMTKGARFRIKLTKETT
ncbi:MAG: HAMP domain-containing sensor histidine kinase, partial [Zetaproteobacteria bacterium]|nr:HAMP domain-containing sensor histidine kinase [Zetaproteobacteria bacterium]